MRPRKLPRYLTHPRLFPCEAGGCRATTELELRMKGNTGGNSYNGRVHLCESHIDLLADKDWLAAKVGTEIGA